MFYLKKKFVVQSEFVEELNPFSPLQSHERGGEGRVDADVHGRIVLVEDEPDLFSVALPARLRHILELVGPEEQSPCLGDDRGDQDRQNFRYLPDFHFFLLNKLKSNFVFIDLNHKFDIFHWMNYSVEQKELYDAFNFGSSSHDDTFLMTQLLLTSTH